MSERRKKAAWPIVAALMTVLLLVPLGSYVGGYFALGTLKLTEPAPPYQPKLVRWFPHVWQAILFYPATRVESLIRGEPVKPDFPMGVPE